MMRISKLYNFMFSEMFIDLLIYLLNCETMQTVIIKLSWKMHTSSIAVLFRWQHVFFINLLTYLN